MTRRNNKRPEGSSQTKVIVMEPILMREEVRKRQAGGWVLTIRDVLANLSLCLLRKLSKPTLRREGLNQSQNIC